MPQREATNLKLRHYRGEGDGKVVLSSKRAVLLLLFPACLLAGSNERRG